MPGYRLLFNQLLENSRIPIPPGSEGTVSPVTSRNAPKINPSEGRRDRRGGEGVGVGAIAAIPTWGEGLSLEHEAITSTRAARGKVCLVK